MSQESKKTLYILDTNVLVGLEFWRPISLEENFWNKLEEALRDEKWVLVDVIVNEIKYSGDLQEWCKKQKDNGLVKKISDDNKERAVKINNDYPMIDEVSQNSKIDTYIIAYAEENNLGIFSREAFRKNQDELYKIPDVCQRLNIKSIRRPIKFFEEIGF